MLAVLSVFWTVAPVAAAATQMHVISNTQVEITGGSGKEAWRLQYGVPAGSASFQPRFATGEGDRAWYSRGGWLRWIDTQKGAVIGRWHYPGEIVNLTPQGTMVEVEIEDKTGPEKAFHRKFRLDPSDPQVPYWPNNRLLLYRVTANEGVAPWSAAINNARPEKLPPEEARKILPGLEEAVRRDPFTPWFRVGLGKVLRDLDDPRAAEEFKAAVNSPGTDFTELLAISSHFNRLGENDLAGLAFERGYRDFWQKGNDPRMVTALFDLLILYAPRGNDWGNPATPNGRALIERTYMLAPYAEGAALAWRFHADYLAVHGSGEEAQLWRARAEDANRNPGLPFTESKTAESADPFLLLAVAAALAAVLFALVLYLRYEPQSRMDAAARKQTGGTSRLATFHGPQCWSRRERFAFFTIVLVGWVSVGVAGQYIAGILRGATLPVSAGAGNYGGPVTIDAVEQTLPASPQRDLLMAIACQQDGRLDKAESLYRATLQFAESWNNLGVILKQKGNDGEARAAFEKALALDPAMAEAALNLGRPPNDFWTEQHQKFLPGRPMLAPPRAAHIMAAVMGGTRAALYLRALEGPFSSQGFGTMFRLRNLFD